MNCLFSRKLMSVSLAMVTLILLQNVGFASHYVRSYYRSNGTFVSGHMSADPGEGVYGHSQNSSYYPVSMNNTQINHSNCIMQNKYDVDSYYKIKSTENKGDDRLACNVIEVINEPLFSLHKFKSAMLNYTTKYPKGEHRCKIALLAGDRMHKEYYYKDAWENYSYAYTIGKEKNPDCACDALIAMIDMRYNKPLSEEDSLSKRELAKQLKGENASWRLVIKEFPNTRCSSMAAELLDEDGRLNREKNPYAY